MFKEKKEEVLVMLDKKDVEEYNRKKESLGFKSKEHWLLVISWSLRNTHNFKKTYWPYAQVTSECWLQF